MPHFDVHDVVVRLGANESVGRVSLGKNVNSVVEVHLNEYAVRNPNGGAVTPSLWRLYFRGDFFSETTTNALGRGYPIVIDNAVMTHVVYTRPRVMSRANKGKIDWLQFEIRDEAGNTVTFDDATFYISFVCAVPEMSLDRLKQDDLQDVSASAFAYGTQFSGVVPGL